MSRDLALAMLRAGSNGQQILMILETITEAPPEAPEAEPEAPKAKTKAKAA